MGMNLKLCFCLKKLAKRSKIVIDVGVHIGKYTVLASKLLGNKGKVICVEPSKENFEILQMNIALNKLENVLALNIAISNFSKKNVKIYKPLRESGRCTLKNIPNATYELVNYINLDHLLIRLKISKIDLIKIDVEGEEVNVIKGFKRYLASHKVESLIIEINNENLTSLRNILNSFGYSLQKIEATNYISIPITKKKF
jgi:FkbM family methyltransferase